MPQCYIPERREYEIKYGYKAGLQLWTLENLYYYLISFKNTNGRIDTFVDQNGDVFNFDFWRGRVIKNGKALISKYNKNFSKNNLRCYAAVDFGYGQILVPQYTLLKMCYNIYEFVAYTKSHPNNIIEVNHMNGCSFDNEIQNLEWTTESLNAFHRSISRLIYAYRSDLTCVRRTADGTCRIALKSSLSVNLLEDFLRKYGHIYKKLKGKDRLVYFLNNI